MANRLKELERSAFHSQMSRHPLMVLPPNSATIYMSTTAGTAFNAGFPISPTLTIAKSFGGASSICIQATVATTFDSTKFVTFEITGRDENLVKTTETVTCVGNAAATQNFTTKGLYSYLDGVRVLASSANLVGTETFTIGTSDGANPPASGNLRVPHPLPGVPFAAVQFLLLNANPLTATNTLTPTSMTADGKQLILTTNYGAAAAVPRTCHVLTTLDSYTVENS